MPIRSRTPCECHPRYVGPCVLEFLAAAPSVAKKKYAPRMPPTLDRECFRESSSNTFDFAYRLDAVARPGSRELGAVKIPASCNAWRPPKTIRKKFYFFWCWKSVFRHFSWILEELRPNGRQNQLQREILLQIDLF